MPLSEAAIANDKSSGATLVPVKEIYANDDFNCRGSFTANTIIELVRDVESRGLIQPIVLRKMWPTEGELVKKGFQYSLVAGFRRLSSYKAAQAELIPATIRVIESEFECHDVNAIENLQRIDLTFWQEAKSIRHYWIAGWSREEVAARVNKSPGWVQSRYMLLGFEPEIQQAADQGFITQSDVRELNKYSGAERLRMAGLVKDARKRGESRNVTSRIKKKEKPEVKKIRARGEVFDMVEHMRVTLKEADQDQTFALSVFVSPQGNTIANRVVAWAFGEISTVDLYMDFRDFCRSVGLNYEIPDLE